MNRRAFLGGVAAGAVAGMLPAPAKAEGPTKALPKVVEVDGIQVVATYPSFEMNVIPGAYEVGDRFLLEFYPEDRRLWLDVVYVFADRESVLVSPVRDQPALLVVPRHF